MNDDVTIANESTNERTEQETRDVILLQNALQLAGFADTGGEAKMLIQSGSVMVNGDVETRRKRKLYAGDVVAIGEDEFLLQLDEQPEE